MVDDNEHVPLHGYAQGNDCFAVLDSEIPEERDEERFTEVTRTAFHRAVVLGGCGALPRTSSAPKAPTLSPTHSHFAGLPAKLFGEGLLLWELTSNTLLLSTLVTGTPPHLSPAGWDWLVEPVPLSTSTSGGVSAPQLGQTLPSRVSRRRGTERI